MYKNSGGIKLHSWTSSTARILIHRNKVQSLELSSSNMAETILQWVHVRHCPYWCSHPWEQTMLYPFKNGPYHIMWWKHQLYNKIEDLVIILYYIHVSAYIPEVHLIKESLLSFVQNVCIFPRICIETPLKFRRMRDSCRMKMMCLRCAQGLPEACPRCA